MELTVNVLIAQLRAELKSKESRIDNVRRLYNELSKARRYDEAMRMDKQYRALEYQINELKTVIAFLERRVS